MKCYEYVEVVDIAGNKARRPMPIADDVPIAHVAPDAVLHIEDKFGEDVLFQSAREAIRFAATREGNPKPPLSSRMVATTPGTRVLRVLAGLDAAAQAGMIMNVIGSLGRLAVAILIADAAPQSMPCSCRRPCCSGHQINRQWRLAIDTIAQDAVRALPAGSKTSYALRSSVIVKIYGGKTTFVEIAKELKVDQETVSRQHRAIHTWLRGAKAGKMTDAVVGIESIAWRDAESALRNHGIVG